MNLGNYLDEFDMANGYDFDLFDDGSAFSRKDKQLMQDQWDELDEDDFNRKERARGI